jgi:hypothetical protein
MALEPSRTPNRDQIPSTHPQKAPQKCDSAPNTTDTTDTFLKLMPPRRLRPAVPPDPCARQAADDRVGRRNDTVDLAGVDRSPRPSHADWQLPRPAAGAIPVSKDGTTPRCLRGRDASYLAPPAQIRTCGFPAYGSHLGCGRQHAAVCKPTPCVTLIRL